MKHVLLCCSLLLTATALFAQNPDEAAIRQRMTDQARAWNKGDLDAFMTGYWHSDSLMFIGKGGITYGYTNTLNNYKKNYENRAKMGTLFFSDLILKKLSDRYYYVTGKWFLKRTVGDIGGYYTLLFRKIGGSWFIVSDHSSAS